MSIAHSVQGGSADRQPDQNDGIKPASPSSAECPATVLDSGAAEERSQCALR